MNSYQSQQELFRLLKKQLLTVQIQSLTAVTIGLTALIATPLIAKNTLSIRDKIINSAGFLIGVSSFGYALILTKHLRVLTGKNKMIEELEKELFIHEQVNCFSNLKTAYLQPAIDVTSVTSTSTNEPLTEVVVSPTTVTSDTSTNTNTSTYLTEDETLNQIIVALENNKSDSYIIENILGYKGRNFAKGKDVLDAYKALLKNS